jgi:hypothetical protein
VEGAVPETIDRKERRQPVGFVGRFEMTVPDILQILSLGKKTGKLRLGRLGSTGEVLFKNGKVTFAASDSTRHTLSNTLISQRRLTESALMAALELQHLSSDNKKLGAILVEKGIITREVLQETLRSQIDQVMSEFLSWENGFFRFDMTEVAADDGIAIDVSEFLTKSGIQPELLFHEGASPVDGSREVEAACPEPLDSARGKPVEGARPEVVEGPLADLVEGQWEGERPPWIKPSPAPDPTPMVQIVEEVTERPQPAPEVPVGPAPAVPRPERFDVDQTSAELSRMPPPEPVERARPEPLDSARGKRVEGPAAEGPTFSIPAELKPPVPARPVASQTGPAVSAGEAPRPVTSAAMDQQVPASVAPSGPSLEGPFQDIEPSRITDEIMLNSPIAPWVLIMHLAADVVGRGVLLFVRKDGITGHDQFGVGGGRDSGDERVINIKIPWNEPSTLAAVTHSRTTYRGKISPGKWNDYFLNQLGGKRPDEAVIIPIIVAGKVVAIFYGDDAGSGTPLGDVERLQAVIDQTFSAVEATILAKRRKTSA